MLEELWKKVDACERCRRSGNPLQHILGGGEEKNPEIMFVFINPTHANISTQKEYIGPRTPFLGTKGVWRVFANAGLLSKELLKKTDGAWNKETITFVLNEMKKAKIYFTNVVKCAKENADMPSREEISEGVEMLKEEISIVNPKRIVAMGQLPFKALTDKSIKLEDYYAGALKGDLKEFNIEVKGMAFPVLPCYFPVGRGNPKRAVELLRRIKSKEFNLIY